MPATDEPNGNEPTASAQPSTVRSAGASSLMRLREVSKTNHMGDVSVPVLHHINLEIHQGESLVVVGPSSADPHARWCGEGARKLASLAEFVRWNPTLLLSQRPADRAINPCWVNSTVL